MKKNIVLMGALSGLATVLTVAPALAADPIKLSVGGSGTVVVGYAGNETSALRGLGGPGTEYTGVDVKGRNNVDFTGETTLDNGLTVAVGYSWFAGGRNGVANPDHSDGYSISVGGGFGTVIAGDIDSALTMIATGAPTHGSDVFWGLDDADLIWGNYVLMPAGFGAGSVNGLPVATYITEGNAEGITYVSPDFHGFTFGASYVPDAGQATDVPNQPMGANTMDVYGVGAAYGGEFNGVSVAVQGGWATADTPAGIDGVNMWQVGATVGYNGFEVGAAYRANHWDLTGPGGDTTDYAWEVGVAYGTGPYGVSLAYLNAVAENVGVRAGEDEAHVWQLTGAYNMGPGVDLVAGLGYVVFDAQARGARNDNEGVVVASGLSLTF